MKQVWLYFHVKGSRNRFIWWGGEAGIVHLLGHVERAMIGQERMVLMDYSWKISLSHDIHSTFLYPSCMTPVKSINWSHQTLAGRSTDTWHLTSAWWNINSHWASLKYVWSKFVSIYIDQLLDTDRTNIQCDVRIHFDKNWWCSGAFTCGRLKINFEDVIYISCSVSPALNYNKIIATHKLTCWYFSGDGILPKLCFQITVGKVFYCRYNPNVIT